MTESTNFNTDSFRDLTFDLLSGIARDPTTFDDVNHAYITKIHERPDAEILKKYVRDIYEKILRKFEFVLRKPIVMLSAL